MTSQRIPVLRVKDWRERFESAKSKDYKIKSQSYMPNKQGLGYNRIVRRPDGPAIYGAWCAMINMLSRMEGPRQGYLTDSSRDTGLPLTPEDIAALTLMPDDLIKQMLDLCRSHHIAWLEVAYIKDTALSLSGAADGPPPLPLPSPSPSQLLDVVVVGNDQQIEANGDNDGSIKSIVQQFKKIRPEFQQVRDVDIQNALKNGPRECWRQALEEFSRDYAGALTLPPMPYKIFGGYVKKLGSATNGTPDGRTCTL